MVAWIMANWQAVVVCILAIDAALIPLLPNVPLLVKIKNALSQVAPKQ